MLELSLLTGCNSLLTLHRWLAVQIDSKKSTYIARQAQDQGDYDNNLIGSTDSYLAEFCFHSEAKSPLKSLKRRAKASVSFFEIAFNWTLNGLLGMKIMTTGKWLLAQTA